MTGGKPALACEVVGVRLQHFMGSSNHVILSLRFNDSNKQRIPFDFNWGYASENYDHPALGSIIEFRLFQKDEA